MNSIFSSIYLNWFTINDRQPYHPVLRVCAVLWGVQYHGGYHDAWGDILSTVGMFSTVRDLMINVGDILSTVGTVQYRGGYHESSTGVILSTMGDIQYRGGYHEYRGVFSTMGVLK